MQRESNTLCRAAVVRWIAAVLIASPVWAGASENDFDAGRATFAVKFRDMISPYRVLGVYVVPGEVVKFETVVEGRRDGFQLVANSGNLRRMAVGKWEWKAPRTKGLYPLKFFNVQSGDSITMNVFVAVPRDAVRSGYLNGYRIGRYPSKAFKNLSIYDPPRAFIEVTPENEETLVSPHFKLKQFICKQESGYPKYLVLREGLLLKLELILEKTNSAGYRCDTFHVMSGYRTPFYNEAIGNVKYSRHVYGGAADIFIDDDPVDELMDDLNGDGRNDYRDAHVLYEIIDAMYGTGGDGPYQGGLARYRKTDAHGPFVHIDVRGYHARWGD